MTGRKIQEPFGLVTQREWDGLIARGADVTHIGMFALLRVRADRDRVTRDSLAALGKRMNRSDDTASTLLAWLTAAGVVTSERKSIRQGPRGLAWICERKALPLDEWKSTEPVRVSSGEEHRADAGLFNGKSTENPPEEHREMTGRAPRTAGYNPDVTQIKPQTAGKALPTGVLDGSEQELAKLSRCETILAESHHSGAFAGKSVELLGLVRKFPDRDIEQACVDLAENVPLIRYDSKALGLLETFVEKAPRVRLPGSEFYCSACETIWQGDRCRRVGLGSDSLYCDGSPRIGSGNGSG